MNDFAIKVNNISKTFDLDMPIGISKLSKKNSMFHKKKLRALEGITFRVRKGEVMGIIGLNGSGKTTLLRVIAGVYQPNSGSVEVNGKLSPLLQLGTGFQGDLDARENIIMNGMLLGISKSDIKNKVNDILQYAELENFVNMKLKHYSTGMRGRLAFATAMQIDPEILLVDEILSVGDIEFQKKSFETFLSFIKSGKTVLHVTHNLQWLSKYSNRIILLDKGRIVAIGQPNVIIKKYRELNLNISSS